MDKYDNYSPSIPDNDGSTADHIESYDLSAVEPSKQRQQGKSAAKSRGKTIQKSMRASSKKANDRSAARKQPGFADRMKEWAHSSNPRLLTGIIIGGLGIYIAVAFISYLAHCIQDQSLVANSPVGSLPPVGNKAGEGGARLSELLINQCFGLGSFVIIFWLITMSLKLLTGWPHFKTVNFTIKCLVALITVSLIIGLVTIGMDSSVNWGGYHGRYVNEFIVQFVGWSGATILSIVLLGIFVVICLRDVINWIMRIKKKHDARKRAIAEERAKRLEEERVLEEMRNNERKEDNVDDEPSETESSISDNPLEFSADHLDSYELGEDIDEDYSSENMSLLKRTEGDDSDPEPTSDVDPKASVENKDASEGEGTAVTLTSDDDHIDGGTPGKEEPRSSMVVNINSISQVENPAFSGSKGLSEFYEFPPFDILRAGETHISVNPQEQRENEERIRKTLLDFGIPIVSITATVGPTVTLYEIRPDKGQKVAKIKSLVDDIALALSATGVRIIAPIPGKGTVGIEVANKNPRMVSMRTVIQSQKFQESNYKLPIALGSTINNDVYVADLTKMPHLLVAGATGQGKSVGLNVIIASLLYRKKPHELKFVMVDPKMVEFSLYAKIEKHYLAKLPGEDKAIITDMSKAVATLNSLVQEMEERYTLLMMAGCRKFEEYNAKWDQGLLNPADGHKSLPYIVVIIDEFCDLIMTAGKEVETPIARLAQKARAVGIHEIIATQRPSATVITGNIKANFITRIAFKVSSGIDSKTILDTTGAQQLIGRGDLLINYNSEMERVQCAFIDTPEVEALTDYISRQPYGGGAYILPEPSLSSEGENSRGGHEGSGEKDPRFYEVGCYVVEVGYASTSNIQRKFSLGYNRAGKIMDQLEEVGIVSASMGSKPRQLLMNPSEAMQVLEQFK